MGREASMTLARRQELCDTGGIEPIISQSVKLELLVLYRRARTSQIFDIFLIFLDYKLSYPLIVPTL